MSSQNEENLKEIFERFLKAEEAAGAVEDIHEGERILREHAGPEPGDELKADIKLRVAEALSKREGKSFKFAFYKVAAVAAVFFILAGVSVRMFEKQRSEIDAISYAAVMPAAIWESEDVSADDAGLALLAADLEEIESEAMALGLGEVDGNGESSVTELEIELIEIDSDFWKG